MKKVHIIKTSAVVQITYIAIGKQQNIFLNRLLLIYFVLCMRVTGESAKRMECSFRSVRKFQSLCKWRSSIETNLLKVSTIFNFDIDTHVIFL